MDIRISTLVDENIDMNKSMDSGKFEEVFNDVVQTSKMNILLANPLSPILLERSNSLNKDTNLYLKNHITSLHLLYDLAHTSGMIDTNSCDIRLYDKMPMVTIHVFKHVGYVSIFNPGEASDLGQTIKFKLDTPFANDIIESHFDKYWESKGGVTLINLKDFIYLVLEPTESERTRFQLNEKIYLHYSFFDENVQYIATNDERIRNFFKYYMFEKKSQITFKFSGMSVSCNVLKIDPSIAEYYNAKQAIEEYYPTKSIVANLSENYTIYKTYV